VAIARSTFLQQPLRGRLVSFAMDSAMGASHSHVQVVVPEATSALQGPVCCHRVRAHLLVQGRCLRFEQPLKARAVQGCLDIEAKWLIAALLLTLPCSKGQTRLMGSLLHPTAVGRPSQWGLQALSRCHPRLQLYGNQIGSASVSVDAARHV